MKTLILSSYFACLILLSIYGLHVYWLVYWENRSQHSRKRCMAVPAKDWPHVTIQLPLYNEPAVVARLIDAVAAFDYPKDRFDIQVLDDSNDGTTQIAIERTNFHSRQGVAIAHLRRGTREGFKAGALAYGVARARGEFLAVFDADNLPHADFLQRMISAFEDPAVGMVQARWGHLNLNDTLLSQAQALYLDGHFFIEQQARSAAGVFFNFNGTAGIWRKNAITSAGGWRADTLTEDLDLSYRAQLAGWRLVYRPDVEVPSELPNDVRAFKSQQYRWARGAIQTARNILPRLWQSSFPLTVKLAATFHLTSKFISVLMVGMTVLMVPALWYRWDGGLLKFALLDLPLFVLATGSMNVFYRRVQRAAGRVESGSWWRMPLLMSVGIGLTITNSRAVVDGLFRGAGVFHRTPKHGITGRTIVRWKSALPFQSTTIIECACGLYALVAIGVALREQLWIAVPFTSTFAIGYLYLAWQGFIGSGRTGANSSEAGT